MTSAGSAEAARPSIQQAGGGAIPTPALHDLRVAPVPFRVAKQLLVAEHYLHSFPGGARISMGVFVDDRLMGAILFGGGPTNVHRLVEEAGQDDCLALTRLWLHDSLPPNSESRVLGVALRSLRQHTSVKFLVSYADPSAGHAGTIYQATGWLYTGLSQAVPRIDIGDGKLRHSRSVAHAYGTHSRAHFAAHGIELRYAEESAKHRYVYFLDRTWKARLRVPALEYPKKGANDGTDWPFSGRGPRARVEP